MKEASAIEKTFLCFDSGCIIVQSISNIIVGALCGAVGIFLLVKNKIA